MRKELQVPRKDGADTCLIGVVLLSNVDKDYPRLR